MSQKLEAPETSSADTVKTIVSLVILFGSIYGYYHFADMHAVVRVLGLLAGVALSAFVFYQTEKGQSWFKYLDQTRKEVRQVVWPKRSETVQMTLIVFVIVIIMGIFLWLVDMFFLWAVQLLTGQGG